MFVHASRRLVGTVLGLLAAVASVWSAFLSWYAGREGSNIRIQDLFTNGITLNNASTMNSLFLPLAFVALLFVVHAIVGWRWLLVLGGLIGIATPLLWGTRQAQTVSGLHAALVGHGPQLAAAAGVLMLIAAVVAPQRKHREAPESGGPAGTAAGYGGEGAYASGYRDAQTGVTSEDPATRLTGHGSPMEQQQAAAPPRRTDGPGA
jgi:hypothetical protein